MILLSLTIQGISLSTTAGRPSLTRGNFFFKKFTIGFTYQAPNFWKNKVIRMSFEPSTLPLVKRGLLTNRMESFTLPMHYYFKFDDTGV